MKVALLLILAFVTISAKVEKHFHYHFDGMNPMNKRMLMASMMSNGNHKNWVSDEWCKFLNFLHINNNSCAQQSNANNNAPVATNAAVTTNANTNAGTNANPAPTGSRRRLNRQYSSYN